MRIGSPLVVLLSFAVAVAVARPVEADVVHLTDGTKVEGDVKRSADGWVVTGAGGKVTAVAAGDVKSIELKPAAAPGTTRPAPDVAQQRLYSLRRSVESFTHIPDVIERYQRFVEQNKGTETGKAAEAELAVWLDRHRRGLVKVGQQWVAPAERDAMLAQTFAIVSEARQLIKDARHREAEALLVKALQADPENPSIHYLRGVLKYRQSEIPAARKEFEMVIEQITNHAPSLNNLGVILARQNAHVASIGMYDRAMQASPLDRQVLDNFAEAFNELPRESRKQPVVQRATKRFLEQDEQLQAAMKQKGLYRWGATWVDEKQLEQVKAAEEKIKGRLDQLASDFDAAQMRIKTIDQDIALNQQTIARLDTQRYGVGPGGGLVTRERSPRALDLEQDTQNLVNERKGVEQRMQQIRAAAKQVEKQVPTPRYTGTQKLIETEGTPIKVPGEADGATTQPATEVPAGPQPEQREPKPVAEAPATQPAGRRDDAGPSPGGLDALFKNAPPLPASAPLR